MNNCKAIGCHWDELRTRRAVQGNRRGGGKRNERRA